MEYLALRYFQVTFGRLGEPLIYMDVNSDISRKETLTLQSFKRGKVKTNEDSIIRTSEGRNKKGTMREKEGLFID